MWELDCEEGWVLKNWCFWTVVLEKTLESPLDCKIKPANPKGNQPWIFIGRTDVEAETPTPWPPDAKNQLTGKDPDAGKDWRQEEKGMTGWDGWIASMTQWTWVWASSRRCWSRGKRGVLLSMGLGHRKMLWQRWASKYMWWKRTYRSISFAYISLESKLTYRDKMQIGTCLGLGCGVEWGWWGLGDFIVVVRILQRNKPNHVNR